MKIQYVFTEEEYLEIEAKHNREKQELCKFIANNVPIKFWSNKEARIWGCILNKSVANYGYCDECPAQNHCPNERKMWSK